MLREVNQARFSGLGEPLGLKSKRKRKRKVATQHSLSFPKPVWAKKGPKLKKANEAPYPVKKEEE